MVHGRNTLRNILTALVAIVGLLAAVACGETKEFPIPTLVAAPIEGGDPSTFVSVSGSGPDTSSWGKSTASLEERIYLSDVVVRARLRSAQDGVLRFGNGQYLKGTGPARFTVRAATEGRNTEWDNQDAILFLKRLTGETEDFEFMDSTKWNYSVRDMATYYTGDLPEGYMVDSRNPVWLPVGSSGASTGARSVDSSSKDGRILAEYDNGAAVTLSQADFQGTVPVGSWTIYRRRVGRRIRQLCW